MKRKQNGVNLYVNASFRIIKGTVMPTIMKIGPRLALYCVIAMIQSRINW